MVYPTEKKFVYKGCFKNIGNWVPDSKIFYAFLCFTSLGWHGKKKIVNWALIIAIFILDYGTKIIDRFIAQLLCFSRRAVKVEYLVYFYVIFHFTKADTTFGGDLARFLSKCSVLSGETHGSNIGMPVFLLLILATT